MAEESAMECSDNQEAHNLKYIVDSWSSYSGNYHPQNIQNDRPNDQSSRWSSNSNYPPQYIMLRLHQPAIVSEITFGKYEKTHVCNLKKFAIFGGINQDYMLELLNDGLQNDCNNETFALRYELHNKKFPCNFIKIVPLVSWGPSFNFSIWHVKLAGVDDPKFVKPRLKWFNKYREQEAIRLCLKHFRRKNYTEAFDALQKKSKVVLENPILTELHNSLVKKGDFEQAELIIDRAKHIDIIQNFVSNQAYKPTWSSITPLNADGSPSYCQPGMRGGHQMCIDSERQLIFLIGGWDGVKDLSDFWVFDITNKTWQCISENTECDGGPSARSCHKMCLDTSRRDLYILGRYLDSTDRANMDLKSDFYKYDLDTGHWQLLSSDTEANGGPQFIFDHQMQYDSVSDKIFVFGGRVLTSVTNHDHTIDPLFSGLFTFHIGTNSWSKLRNDMCGLFDSGPMKARSGHSMVINERSRLLYIFAGQRGREYLNDFFSYHMDTGEVKSMPSKLGNKELPGAGFTQRATIDRNTEEIYVLSGLSKDKEKREESVRNSFWVYSVKTNRWSCVYKNEHVGQHYWNKMDTVEPRPRFAHQLVYDPNNKVHYLFGGNPGKSTTMKLRLDDFWMLKLQRSTVDDIVRECKYLIRKLRYDELTKTDPIAALEYLRTDVSQCVNHDDTKEREKFESLATSLFTQPSPSSSSDEDDKEIENQSDNISTRQYNKRTEIFEELINIFPRQMTQPKANITDFILS